MEMNSNEIKIDVIPRRQFPESAAVKIDFSSSKRNNQLKHSFSLFVLLLGFL